MGAPGSVRPRRDLHQGRSEPGGRSERALRRIPPLARFRHRGGAADEDQSGARVLHGDVAGLTPRVAAPGRAPGASQVRHSYPATVNGSSVAVAAERLREPQAPSPPAEHRPHGLRRLVVRLHHQRGAAALAPSRLHLGRARAARVLTDERPVAGFAESCSSGFRSFSSSRPMTSCEVRLTRSSSRRMCDPSSGPTRSSSSARFPRSGSRNASGRARRACSGTTTARPSSTRATSSRLISSPRSSGSSPAASSGVSSRWSHCSR